MGTGANGLKRVRLKAPLSDEDIASLELGTVVYLDGVVYTGREGVYKRVLDEGVMPPGGFASIGNVNFHCSPAAARRPDGSFVVGAVTATASFRFNAFLDRWLKLSGAKVIIGKGGMTSEVYRRLLVPNGAIYLTTVGYGTGALLGRGIKRVREVVWLEELGLAQAMWVFEVENFGPFLVESNLKGESLFEGENAAIAARIGGLYEGLKTPILRRYGETDDKSEELI